MGGHWSYLFRITTEMFQCTMEHKELELELEINHTILHVF